MTLPLLSILLLAAVTAQRLAELVIARANTARLLSAGAQEYGAGHYPVMVVLHAAWLAGLWVLGWDAPVNLIWLAVYLLATAGRIWTLTTLGRRWTTRIIVVPDEALVARGPYRFVSHPNYLVVAVEIAVLPLVFGLVWYAAVFTALNTAMLFVRIRAENAALETARKKGGP